MMICLNKLRDLKCNKRSIVKDFTILLSPFAPHIAEEIWQKLGNKTSVAFAKMPDYDPNKILKKNIQYQFHLMVKLDSNWISVLIQIRTTFKNVF